MKRWQANAFSVASLALADLATPEPGPNQVLVRVGAVSLNYRDKLVLVGGFGTDFELPLVPASDASGTVVAVGSSVKSLLVGDRITSHFYPHWHKGQIRTAAESANLGAPLAGVLSEYIVLDEGGVVRTPAYLTDAQAATLPVAALTAWSALFERCCIQPGDSVLVQGTGGVSIFGLQLARAAGARVIVTSSSDDKLERAKRLGASNGINYVREPEWQETVKAVTDGNGVDHVIEIAGGDSVRRSVEALARGGNIAVVGFLQDGSFNLPILPIMQSWQPFIPLGWGLRKPF